MKKIFYKLLFFYFFILLDAFSVNVRINCKDPIDLHEIFSERDLFLTKSKDIHDIDDIKVNLNKDIELIQKMLHQNGFFDVKVSNKITLVKKKYNVVINIDTGNRYKITKINYNIPVTEFQSFFDNFIGLGFCISELSDRAELLLSKLREIGYKDVSFKELSVVKNPLLKTVEININIDLKEKKYFGETFVIGNKKVNTEYIQKKISWKKGDVLNISVVRNFEKKLLSTSLFKFVNVKFKDSNDNTEDVIIEVSEYEPHIIELGGRFATSNNVNYKNAGIKKLKGVSLYSSWTNLNLFGNGELFKISADGMPFYEKNKILEATSDIKVLPEYSFSLELSNCCFFNNYIPNVHVSNVKGKIFQIWTTRYIKKSSCVGFELENNKKIKNFKSNISCNLENYSLREFLEEDFSKKSMHNYLNIKYSLDFDYRDSFLDATKGFRSVSFCMPCISFNKKSVLKLQSANYYFFPIRDFVFVPWIIIKSILCKKDQNIPCDKLLYSGGPGSLRGYYTNFAGNVRGHVPLGGKTVSEFGVEVRRKFNTDLGVCIFLEGAKISQKSWNVMSGNIYSDFGIGIRYYTSIGPIRVDLAFPTRVRKYVDSKCQIIVALGQSF